MTDYVADRWEFKVGRVYNRCGNRFHAQVLRNDQEVSSTIVNSWGKALQWLDTQRESTAGGGTPRGDAPPPAEGGHFR